MPEHLQAVTSEPSFAPRKLDVACGQNKTKGYKGIDISGDADILHDLFEFPWPIKSDSVRELVCNHFVEHIPHRLPGIDREVSFAFFDEVYRICKPNAMLIFRHPYSRNDRAFWDWTHERYIHWMSWYYLQKDWRQANGLDHYPVNCDFEVVTINSGFSNDIETRNDEFKQFATEHSFNVVGDLEVTLRCRKEPK